MPLGSLQHVLLLCLGIGSMWEYIQEMLVEERGVCQKNPSGYWFTVIGLTLSRSGGDGDDASPV
jgi:hypothetical protein